MKLKSNYAFSGEIDMSEKKQGQINLDDVIMAYMASSVDSGEDSLAEWIARYPEYESELREFASYSTLIEQIPPQEYTVEEEQRLAARAASVIQNILYEKRQSASERPAEAFSGIIEEAERQNMSLDEFAERTELSPVIITMVDDRRVRYLSIPRKAIENIANTLRKIVTTIDSYLKGEMQLAPAHYKSDAPPKASGSYEFAHLVSIDPDLSPQQKEQWLALASAVDDSKTGAEDQLA